MVSLLAVQHTAHAQSIPRVRHASIARSLSGRSPFFQSMHYMNYIPSMNLASLDLNLLVALDALLSEGSVSRAALRIGLSRRRRATHCAGCATSWAIRCWCGSGLAWS